MRMYRTIAHLVSGWFIAYAAGCGRSPKPPLEYGKENILPVRTWSIEEPVAQEETKLLEGEMEKKDASLLTSLDPSIKTHTLKSGETFYNLTVHAHNFELSAGTDATKTEDELEMLNIYRAGGKVHLHQGTWGINPFVYASTDTSQGDTGVSSGLETILRLGRVNIKLTIQQNYNDPIFGDEALLNLSLVYYF